MNNMFEEEYKKMEETAEEPKNSADAGESLEQKLEKERDGYLRIIAQHQNELKRYQKDAENLVQFMVASIIKDIVPIINDIKSAQGQAITEDQKKGLDLVMKNFTQVLGKHGVTEIDSQSGMQFDSNKHQAIMEEESETIESGKIIRTIKEGFEFQGKTITPALVIIAK
jgi:molecular chaperone GrpE